MSPLEYVPLSGNSPASLTRTPPGLDKVDLVKEIITLLAHNVTSARSGERGEMKQLPLEIFWEDDLDPSSVRVGCMPSYPSV